MDERKLSELAERVEAEYMAAMFELAPAEVREALGMEYVRVGGGVATAMANDPTGAFWSRAVGFGWSRPIDDEMVELVRSLNLRHRVGQAWFQVSPMVSGEWETVLEAHGFTPGGTWVKFIRDTSTPPEVYTRLDVRELGANDADDFARVYWAGFEVSDVRLEAWARAQVGRPEWKLFGAFERGEMVGCAALMLDSEVGGLMGAATLPAHRGKGAQSALMAARLRAAAHEGCRWVFTETGAETPDNPNPSMHNMRRMGFSELYERRNWVADLAAG
jgi:GNAT superfamily N-acetyltransferase